MDPFEVRRVPSYRDMTVSMALTRRRWMYPVSAVLHAVSMSPSLPPMAWKKNSCGLRPRRYEFSTKPRDSGPRSSLLKCGRVLFLNPHGIRFPSTFCCPTHAIICEMLIKDPLDPAVTMALTELVSSRLSCAFLPEASRAVFSTLLTYCSKDSIIVRPGCPCSSPACPCRTKSCTCSLAWLIVSSISFMVATSATVSVTPMLKEFWRHQ
mmetsp:Transcript_4220/g.8818  ORF Transcript_4220/g.8818 Transcript_4220/m.8818 type:complete len:209 (+) Transcript_4220:2194-2820(+)